MGVMAMIGGAALSGLTSGIKSGVSGLTQDVAGGIFGGRKRHNQRKQMRYAMQLQDYYETKRMQQQYEYAKEAAAKNQEYAKEMWDYTNYENQREHLENAGLNPGLLYGMSGGGGSSTAGSGKVETPSQGTSQAVAMGLQASIQQAQIRDLEASARLKEAEAAKTAGVDTEKVKSDIKVNESVTNLNEINANVRKTEGKNIEQQTENLKKEWEKLEKEIGILAVQKDIAEETKEANIQKAINEAWNTMYTGFEIVGKINLNEAQMNYINEQTEWYAYEAMTGRISAKSQEKNAETLAKQLTEQIKKWNKELTQADERILQEWFKVAISGIGTIGETVSEFLPTKVFQHMVRQGKEIFSKTTKTR